MKLKLPVDWLESMRYRKPREQKPLDPAVKAKWLEALKSGKYLQARGALRGVDGPYYCCLGVFAETCIGGDWLGSTFVDKQGREYTQSLSIDDSGPSRPTLGLTHDTRAILTHINDNSDDFEAVILWIERNL